MISQSRLSGFTDLNGTQPFKWKTSSTLKGYGTEFTINPIYEFDVDRYVGINAAKINSDGFNLTNTRLKIFNCYECALEHQPPRYDLQAVLNKLTALIDLQIGLNLTQNQPLNDILPNQPSNLDVINIKANRLTIKSGALNSLEHLASLSFNAATIDRIERDAFKTNYTSNLTRSGVLYINFRNCNLDKNVFQNGSFNGIGKSTVQITFESTNITSLPERAFKSFLDENGDWSELNSTTNSIAFTGYSTIDCDDCENYWLIKEKKEMQVINSRCKVDPRKTLFDMETKTKLSQKCQ